MATTQSALTTTAWTLIGASPCQIEVVGSGGALVVLDTAAPTSLDAPAIVMSPQAGTTTQAFSLSGQNVYARAAQLGQTTSIIYAPTSGSAVSVSNFPATQAVSGTVALGAGTAAVGTVGVTALPALPTGANAIGTVGVTALPALPAGANAIGTVGVTSLPALPAGANTIGAVSNIPANTDAISAVPALAAAAAGSNGADQTNANARGLKLVVNITAITGTTPTLTVTVQGKDPVSGAYYTILASAALSAVGATVLTVYPGLTAATNAVANDVLPKTWRVITAIAGTTPAVTATIGASLVI